MNCKCVIFDMDGLMFDSERIVAKLHKDAAKQFGYTITDTMIENLLGGNKERNNAYLIKEFGLQYPVDQIRKVLLDNRDAYIEKHGLPIKKGLIELLQYLKQKEIKIAVASSSPLDVINYYLTITNTKHYIEYIISGDRVAHSKPDPEIFLNVCHHFSIKPSEALVLEDSRNGIMAAVNGNIPVICIPDLIEHNQEITLLTYKTLPSLLDVVDVLEETLH